MTPIRTILCPVDFSEASEEALRYAVSFADRIGAETVHLLHVYQRPGYATPDLTLYPEPTSDVPLRQYLDRELESMAKRYSSHGVEVRTHLVEGVPHEQVAEQVADLGAELVVIGTHGRSGLSHLLLGSIAEKVVRHSSVPVCTVRSPDAK